MNFNLQLTLFVLLTKLLDLVIFLAFSFWCNLCQLDLDLVSYCFILYFQKLCLWYIIANKPQFDFLVYNC